MKFFGTDGIRGRAGEGKLSDASIGRVGAALAGVVGPGGTVAIGRDTRESGPHIQRLFQDALLARGVDVIDLGVLPTPGTALLTQRMGADLGVMITASHNPWTDNGFKIFAPDGRKLSDAMQAELERRLVEPAPETPRAGAVRAAPDAGQTYLDHITATLGSPGLAGIKVVTDGANGAAHALLPRMFRMLGAEVIDLGIRPDGRNINAGVGSTAPERCRKAVLEHGAHVGFALDGDADRILAVDSAGGLVDGDQIIARLAQDACGTDRMASGAVVSTVMANLGLERWAEANGLRLERTAVGDRHVAARMEELGARVGGEPSGHILMTDVTTTGDGCLTALALAASLAASGQDSAAWFRMFSPVPQTLRSVRYASDEPLSAPGFKAALAAQTERLSGAGRILVRASGTEPVIRVMAEGDDAALVSDVVDILCAAIA